RAEAPAVKRTSDSGSVDLPEREVGTEVRTPRVDGMRPTFAIAEHRDASIPQLEGSNLLTSERARPQRGVPRPRRRGRIGEDARSDLVKRGHWRPAAAAGVPDTSRRSRPPMTQSQL